MPFYRRLTRLKWPFKRNPAITWLLSIWLSSIWLSSIWLSTWLLFFPSLLEGKKIKAEPFLVNLQITPVQSLGISGISEIFKLSTPQLQIIYNSLEDNSISQHLAYYLLYPEEKIGQLALAQALKLLSVNSELPPSLLSSIADFHPLINLLNPLNPLSSKKDVHLKEGSNQKLAALLIGKLAHHLANRSLLGYQAKNEAQVLQLPPEEIDIARALLIAQLGSEQTEEIASYEGQIDWMALEIQATLPANPQPEEIIAAINHYIFFKHRFRFPPKSLSSEEIDRFTFLSSVLDARQGVCLGVSILYLAIAQRLNLKLVPLTPPGHIFLSYQKEKASADEAPIHIETTLRGVHLPLERYLGLSTYQLQQRSLKEIVGLAFVNQASIYWQKDQLDDALKAYEKAKLYLKGDLLLDELTAFCLIAKGEQAKGMALLQNLQGKTIFGEVRSNRLIQDCLEGKTNKEGIKHIFAHIDQEEQSILAKKQILENDLKAHPHFCSGLFQLATCWLELGRSKEALELLLRYHQIDSSDPVVEYYIAHLWLEQYQFKQAWHHLHLSERLLPQTHRPLALKSLKKQLRRLCPQGEIANHLKRNPN